MIHVRANSVVGSGSSRSKVLKFGVIIAVSKRATLTACSSTQFKKVAAPALYTATGFLVMNIEINAL
jgi:hypothetical protein